MLKVDGCHFSGSSWVADLYVGSGGACVLIVKITLPGVETGHFVYKMQGNPEGFIKGLMRFQPEKRGSSWSDFPFRDLLADLDGTVSFVLAKPDVPDMEDVVRVTLIRNTSSLNMLADPQMAPIAQMELTLDEARTLADALLKFFSSTIPTV